MSLNFALTGVAGYIAPRHLRAIKDTGNQLIAAVDPHDSVGILDQYFMDARYFTEIERFDRHLEKLRRGTEEKRVHYVTICSPNYLHDAHCRLALRIGAHVICEKPLVINPWNLDALKDLESESSAQIYSILQLRLHPKLQKLRETLLQERGHGRHEVCLTYVTPRGAWYTVSWKGSAEKSGGIATNIGIHLFDLLIWLFGKAGECRVYHSDPQRMTGYLEFERAGVKWFLSVDPHDLRLCEVSGGKSSCRMLTIDSQPVEFTEGFNDLHTRAYEEIFAGRGFRIEDCRPSIELAHTIRSLPTLAADAFAHPLLARL